VKIVIHSYKSYNLLEFQVKLNEADSTHYAKINEHCFVILGAVALFSTAKLTKSSKKHLEN